MNRVRSIPRAAHRGVGFACGPPPAFFFFLDQNCDRALKLCTQPQANKQPRKPPLKLPQGGAGARITAQSGWGWCASHPREGGEGYSQGSSELDSERRRVQCALQREAMDRHVSSSSGSSWLTASSIMPLSFLSRSYHVPQSRSVESQHRKRDNGPDRQQWRFAFVD